MTFFFKEDKIIGVYRYDWKQFGQNENKKVVKAGKEETPAGHSRKVHFPMKGKKYESPAPEPVIKDGKEEIICLLDGKKEKCQYKSKI